MPDTTVSTNVATAFVLRTPTKIDTLVIDCSLDETHTIENEVTDHPVETGFNVTDHVRAKPDTFQVRGIVSDTPLSKTQRTRQIQALGITFDAVGEEEFIVGQPGYAAQAYQALVAMRNDGKLMTVTTGLRTYDNVVMVSLVVPRNAQQGDSLQFTAQFKRVRIVSNKLTAAKKSQSPAKKVSAGKQSGKSTDAATKKKSIAYEARESGVEAFNKIKGFFGGTP